MENKIEETHFDGAVFNKPSNRGNDVEERSQDVVDNMREPGSFSKPVFRKEDLFYDMSGEKFLIVFNHLEYKATKYYGYKAPKKRNGTECDVKSLKYVFGNLGFKVLVYTDFTHDKIISHVGRISQQDHTRTSCLAIAILTHGDRGDELYAEDRSYNLKDIVNLLEYGHPSLVNKPKLFFIQACRGDLVDSGRTIQIDGAEDNIITVPSHSDFLFLRSTVEDFLSWRDIGGSWMIQELCEVIKAYSEQFDLLHLITLATRNVAYGRASHTPKHKTTHKKKQTLETRFTLTKLVHF